jgi:glycosyltransferase involved in cell wall biosynthesis
MSEPRLLHVITGLSTGGAEMMLYKLVSSTPNRAAVVSMGGDGPMGKLIRDAGVQVVSLGMRPGIPDPRAVLRLVKIIRKWKPDVVQTWMYHADLLGGLAARLSGVPVVWNIRQSTLDRASSKLHTRLTLAVCAKLSRTLPSRIICCSDAGRNLHTQLGYDAARMVLIPNGFDTEMFRPRPEIRKSFRRDFGIPEESPVIGLIARFDPQKDHESFFSAAGRLRESFPEARYLLCGSGVDQENPQIRQWIASHGLGDRTLLLGRRDDVHHVMNALDIVASSSYQEGFPNVIGEAMSSGVPCVVTDAGDSAMIVGDAGITVPPRDPAALADGWASILRMEALQRECIGRAARNRIIRHFSIQAVVGRYEDLYSRVKEIHAGNTGA